jgi:glycosyltransferase involved in cell wall biosynthesis
MAAQHEWQVEVWTTAATNSLSWENEIPTGVKEESGITVKRFAIDEWDPSEFHKLNLRLQRQVNLSLPDQYAWVNSGPHSSALSQHIKDEAAKFDAVILMPYLSSIIFDAALMAGDNAVIWPCMHDEVFAYMEPFRLMMESAYGVVFISPEEEKLAVDDFALSLERRTVIGSGVELSAEEAVNCIDDERPYLLYFGRLEHGKNVPILYEFVSRYVEQGGDLRLVIAGDGPCTPPEKSEFEYVGFVTEAEKKRLMANAIAICQPSYHESFSLVTMESWLAGRPTLVWSGCDVTRGHVQRSKGGLWFDSYAEFEATVDWLKQNEDAASRMGSNGRDYVEENFTWKRVFNRFAEILEEWKEVDRASYHG